MAIFNNGLTVNSELQVNGHVMHGGLSDVSGWTFLSHCADATTTTECNPTYACGRLHVRTPIPADSARFNYNPIIMHVVGYHSYAGERTSNWKALIDMNGDNGQFYSAIENDRTAGGPYKSDPWIYQSDNTYGGHKRVCFAINKVGCCCTGYLWVKFFNLRALSKDYPWATLGLGDSITSPRKAF